MMGMFDPISNAKRIGPLEKSISLDELKEVETYFLEALKKYDFTASYDVMANEVPFFKTLNYTEWAHCFMIHPLNNELRIKQVTDSIQENKQDINYIPYFQKKVESNANKYKDRKAATREPREYLVALVGSNKLKEHVCLNKLKWIKNTYKDQVFFKPHPITTHQIIGEVKDVLGGDLVLDRDEDLYYYLKGCSVLFGSHLTESIAYAISLGKSVEPIDVYNKEHKGSFYHINKYLFYSNNPAETLNAIMNNYKAGIICPSYDTNWREKIDNYLHYISSSRDVYRNKYIENTKK